MREYSGQKDVQGMIMARMLFEATDGYIADALTRDKDAGRMKGEHTEDLALQQLNKSIQDNPDELIAGLGIYVSTPNGKVFNVPKADAQVDVANNLLFANRGIVLQKVMLNDEPNPSKIVTSMAAGSEFLEGDNRTAIALWKSLASGALSGPEHVEEAEHARKQLEWHRTNWFSIVNTMNPGLFAEMVMIADIGKADNRLFLKPAKYNPGRDLVVKKETTALEAFALTNHYEPTYDKMPAIRMTPNTPKGKHGLSSPRAVTKFIGDGLFPSGNMRVQIGERTKWVDKFGPYNEDYGIGFVPTMCSVDELKAIRANAVSRLAQRNVPTPIKIISEEKLDMVADANDHFNKLFLDATLSEVMGTAMEQETLFANFAASQLYFVGRALQFMPHSERATEMYGRLNDFLVGVMAVPGAASTQVREASRLVLEGCLPYYPEGARNDFLKKFTKMCVENTELLKQWQGVMLPMAHRAQSFLPEIGEEGEMSGVRPELATKILALTRNLFNAAPDLDDKPGSLINMLMGENLSGNEFSFALQALQMTWFLGTRLHFKPGDEFVAGGDKRLSQLNREVQDITGDAEKRLAYEFARRLRIEAPMEAILGFSRVINIVERLSGDQRGVQERLLNGFASMAGVFEEDLLVTTEDGSVRLMTLPKKIPGMEDGGMFHIVTDADAKKLIDGMRTLAGTDENGAISEIMVDAEDQIKTAPDLAEKIIASTFGRGAVRDSLILQEVGGVLASILGVPQEKEGGDKTSGKQTLPRGMGPFISNLWGPYTGGYGRALGLVSLLAARDQSLGRGSEAISNIVDSLMQAEQSEATLSMNIARETGVVGAVRSTNDLAKGMNALLLQRLGDAKQMMGVTDGFRIDALKRSSDQLKKVEALEAKLMDLHGHAHEEELEIAEKKLAMRKLQITAAETFVTTQFPLLLQKIFSERRQVVEQLTQLSSRIQASQNEVIEWLVNCVDPHGNQTQLRLKLQEKLREFAGIDDWIIEAPTLAQLVAFTGLKMEEEDINAMTQISDDSRALLRKKAVRKKNPN